MAAFELVLVTAPDRLARKYVHQVLLIEEMKKLGCDIQFLERPMQENDPHDQLLLQIRGAVAEYERSLIADRMRRGRQAKLRAGSLLPSTRAPYGYILDPERPRDPGRVRIDPVKANIVRQIFAWYTDPETSVSIHWVVKQLNEQQIPTPRGGKRWKSIHGSGYFAFVDVYWHGLQWAYPTSPGKTAQIGLVADRTRSKHPADADGGVD